MFTHEQHKNIDSLYIRVCSAFSTQGSYRHKAEIMGNPTCGEGVFLFQTSPRGLGGIHAMDQQSISTRKLSEKDKTGLEADKPKFLVPLQICRHAQSLGKSGLPHSAERKCQVRCLRCSLQRGPPRGQRLKGRISICDKESQSIFMASQLKEEAIFFKQALVLWRHPINE